MVDGSSSLATASLFVSKYIFVYFSMLSLVCAAVRYGKTYSVHAQLFMKIVYHYQFLVQLSLSLVFTMILLIIISIYQNPLLVHQFVLFISLFTLLQLCYLTFEVISFMFFWGFFFLRGVLIICIYHY